MCPLGQGFDDFGREGGLGAGDSLAEEGENGDAGVAANDWDINLVHIYACLFRVKGLGTHNIQGGNTKETFLVVDAHLFQCLSSNWDGGVDWVGDDVEESTRAVFSASFNQALDNASIDLEEIIASHSRFTWDTCWDDDDVTALQCLSELVVTCIACDLGIGVNVADVSCNTRGASNIV